MRDRFRRLRFRLLRRVQGVGEQRFGSRLDGRPSTNFGSVVRGAGVMLAAKSFGLLFMATLLGPAIGVGLFVLMHGL